MAVVQHVFRPEGAIFNPTIAAPQITAVTGTNYGAYWALFDPSTPQYMFFVFRAVRYGGSSITVDIEWTSGSAGATSGNVVWDVAVACVTPDSDNQSWLTKNFGTAVQFTDSHLGSTDRRVMRAVGTLTAGVNVDSMAEDDLCVLRIGRDASSGSDTFATAAGVILVALRYNDS